MKLQKEIDFILAVDALKNVNRRNYNLDSSRRENTAEHSWQIVVFAQLLYPYARDKDKINLLRVLQMLSIHDLVEIDAGDTFLFDESGNEDKWEREKKAADRIFGILDEPKRSEFYDLWIEFEESETPDAIFALAVDRMMPFLLNSFNKGESWLEGSVNETQARKMVGNAIARASDEMAEYFEELLLKAKKDGVILEG